MNVLYVDIDGVLNSWSNKDAIVDRMVKVLSDICKTYDCKVCIESTKKPNIYDEEEESLVLIKLKEAFEKYEIDCIGFTPRVEIHKGFSILSDWKDFEIIYHLSEHPEIEHFAVIDDNDFRELFLLKDYLVETEDYVEGHPEKEGLLEHHKEEVGKILVKENRFKNSRR